MQSCKCSGPLVIRLSTHDSTPVRFRLAPCTQVYLFSIWTWRNIEVEGTTCGVEVERREYCAKFKSYRGRVVSGRPYESFLRVVHSVPKCPTIHKVGYTLSHFASVFRRTHHEIRNTHYTLSHFMRISCFINAAKK